MVKSGKQKCALVLVADGFEEIEAVTLLSVLRQAGISVKSVGLTGGLISSARGVWLKPDLALADLDHSIAISSISLVILPGGEPSLSRLEADPRVHKLLCGVIAQQGQIAAQTEGRRVLRIATMSSSDLEGDELDTSDALLFYSPESVQAFAQDLARLLGYPA